jgi:hypothetical protein
MNHQPFDISMKDLIERDPMGWAQSFSPEPVLAAQRIESDASTLSAADKVLRVWTQPEAAFLRGPLALLPLAALTDEAEPHLAETVEQSLQRIRDEAPASEASTIQLALFLLLGLRYDPAVTESLFLRAKAMQESSTYHWLKERDARIRAEGLREGILRTGRKKLGEPSAHLLAALEKIDNHDRLRALADAVGEAVSWDDLGLGE